MPTELHKGFQARICQGLAPPSRRSPFIYSPADDGLRTAQQDRSTHQPGSHLPFHASGVRVGTTIAKKDAT